MALSWSPTIGVYLKKRNTFVEPKQYNLIEEVISLTIIEGSLP